MWRNINQHVYFKGTLEPLIQTYFVLQVFIFVVFIINIGLAFPGMGAGGQSHGPGIETIVKRSPVPQFGNLNIQLSETELSGNFDFQVDFGFLG